MFVLCLLQSGAHRWTQLPLTVSVSLHCSGQICLIQQRMASAWSRSSRPAQSLELVLVALLMAQCPLSPVWCPCALTGDLSPKNSAHSHFLHECLQIGLSLSPLDHYLQYTDPLLLAFPFSLFDLSAPLHFRPPPALPTSPTLSPAPIVCPRLNSQLWICGPAESGSKWKWSSPLLAFLFSPDQLILAVALSTCVSTAALSFQFSSISFFLCASSIPSLDSVASLFC